MELEMTVDRVTDREPKQTRLMVKCGGPEKAASLVTDWATTMGSLHTDLQKMVCDIDSLFGLVRWNQNLFIPQMYKYVNETQLIYHYTFFDITKFSKELIKMRKKLEIFETNVCFENIFENLVISKKSVSGR